MIIMYKYNVTITVLSLVYAASYIRMRMYTPGVYSLYMFLGAAITYSYLSHFVTWCVLKNRNECDLQKNIIGSMGKLRYSLLQNNFH